MIQTIRALVWEICWKNRILAPALALLLGLGAWMISRVLNAIAEGLPIDASYYPLHVALLAFMASLVLVFSPFTLLESHSGWRMNSMITRWFVLPVPTLVLVMVPLALGMASVAAVFGAWWTLLRGYISPEVFQCELALLLATMSIVQCFAWATPRKPWQFWIGIIFLSYLFLSLFIFFTKSSEIVSKQNEILMGCALVATIAAFLAYLTASLSRRGIWPGGFLCSITDVPSPFKRKVSSKITSAQAALSTSETRPVWRLIAWIWAGIVLLVMGFALLKLMRGQWEQRMGYRFLLVVAINLLPLLGIVCLSPVSLVAGCVSPGIFRTQISPYLATQPVTAGTIAQARIMGIVFAWLIVWIPLMLLGPLYQRLEDNPGDVVASARFYSQLGWLMVISAHVAVGALPLFLLGRLEGLPTLILAMLGAWAFTWLFSGILKGDEQHIPTTSILIALLTVKLGITAIILTYNVMRNHMTMRFVFYLVLGWLIIGCSLGIASWNDYGISRALAMVILLPLARLAACPMAVAFNRHR